MLNSILAVINKQNLLLYNNALTSELNENDICPKQEVYINPISNVDIPNILEKKTIRLDIYLYYIRIFKSRSIATKFVSTNRLRISGQVTQKPHKMISIGDVLTITINDNIKILKV